MTRAERLSLAAERWDVKSRLWFEADMPYCDRHGTRRMNSLSYRLWCLKHAKRCVFLALRAYRQEQVKTPDGRVVTKTRPYCGPETVNLRAPWGTPGGAA